MNSADFWAHVDRSGGPDNCWPWLGATDRRGRGRYRYQGVIRPLHHVVAYLRDGVWPKHSEIKPCPKLASCCNFSHLERRPPARVRPLSRNIERTQRRQRGFLDYLARAHPDFMWLVRLLGTNAATFLTEHEGREITLKMTVPTRAQLIEESRAADCCMSISEARHGNADTVIERLAKQYQCDAASIIAFAKIGQTLLFREAPREKAG